MEYNSTIVRFCKTTMKRMAGSAKKGARSAPIANGAKRERMQSRSEIGRLKTEQCARLVLGECGAVVKATNVPGEACATSSMLAGYDPTVNIVISAETAASMRSY
jgi:hypothetical protein